MTSAANRLRDVLSNFPRLTVAVSGGVDSLTLAVVAGRQLAEITAAHAISPAVPAEATERVKTLAAQEGWNLKILNAREFSDPNYLKNPANRCYFCKSNLYQRIAETCDGPIASGTNTDDLGEYRPGLIAAQENAVVHPYIMAQISKSELRQIAHDLGLRDIASLPAQPCLASRVETGLAITEQDLAFIHRIENLVRTQTTATDVRCRLTANGVRLETSNPVTSATLSEVEAACIHADRRFDGAFPYRRGSAFLLEATE